MTDDSKVLARFETTADLYYKRFGRLAPGKSEAAATYRDSSDDENCAQFSQWYGRLAFEDAIDRIAVLEEKIEAKERDCDCD